MAVVPYRSSLVPTPTTAQQTITPRPDRSIPSALNTVAGEMDKYYQRLDENNAQKLLNQYRTEANELDTQYKTMQMEDAYNGISNHRAALTETRAKYMSQVGNDRQYDLLDAAIGQAEVAYNDSGYKHAAGELTKWEDLETETALKLDKDDAINYRYNPAQRDQAIARAGSKLDYHLDKRGVAKDIRESKVAELNSVIHLEMVSSFLADRAPEAAQDYFNEHLAEIQPGKQRDAVQDALNKSLIIRASQQQHDAIWSEHQDDQEAATKAVRKIKDPELRDSVMKRINSSFSQQKHIDAEAERKAKIEVADFVVSGGDPDEITNHPIWSQYYTLADVNKMKNDQVNAARFGINYTKSEDELILLQSDVLGMTIDDQRKWLNNFDIRNYSTWNNQHKAALLSFREEREIAISKGEALEKNPKNVMIRGTKKAVDDLIDKAFGVKSKRDKSKEKRLQVETFRRVLEQYVDEEEFERDTPEFREKVTKIASALLIEDADTLGDSEGFLFQHLDSVGVDEDLADDFLEEIPTETRRELAFAMEQQGVPLTKRNAMRIYLLSQGIDINGR